MPQLLLAFDKFKGTLSAESVCSIVSDSLLSSQTTISVPLTDGGDGFVRLLAQHVGAPLLEVEVRGPLMRPVMAAISIVPHDSVPLGIRKSLDLKGGSLALIEMASASGIALISEADRDPFQTTSYGTGELLRHAALHQPEAILLGIGGSATNDLGLGALHALGLSFHTDIACPVLPTPEKLPEFKRFDLSKKVTLPPVYIACDVTNPLLGPNGCTQIFGPQKGLRPQDIDRAENDLKEIATALCAAHGKDMSIAEEPGMGAAGGIGFGLHIAYGAQLVPGFETVSKWFDLEGSIEKSDIVVTGEGRFDNSSLHGKGPAEILRQAASKNKRLAILSGSVDREAVKSLEHQLGTEIIVESLIGDGVAFDPAIHNSEALLQEATHRLAAKF